ncbi:hypothetical protein A9Q91_02940 [Candidatus Gracilibacteria bacterium 28_42_T64]|nr:hypothetical protein A9Q91_02940 [Candidatus Gracilibacteria bacterium 28_42_T64]
MLKEKFHVSIGPLEMTSVIEGFMWNYIKDFEKQYGQIPISPNNSEKYDIIRNMFGVKITKTAYKDFLDGKAKRYGKS